MLIQHRRIQNLPDSTAHDNHTSTKYIGPSSGAVQPLPLDAALLCSKLNLHKKEQDALRRSREKRESFRNGQYVPRSAAKSFAVTTTTTYDEVTPHSRRRKHISEPLPMIAEPFAVDGKVRAPHRQAPVLTEEPDMLELEEEEAAGFRLSEEKFDLAAALAAISPLGFKHPSASERHDSKRNSGRSQKHDSMDPAATETHARDFHSLVTPDLPELQPLPEMPSLPDLQPLAHLRNLQPTPPRRRSSARSEDSDSADRGRAPYRPGDAAKRRSLIDTVPRSQQDRSTSSNYYTETRTSRFLEEEVVLNARIPEVDTPPVVERRVLTANDRPGWSQRPETDDGVRHTFNLHVFSHTEKKSQRSQSALLESSMLAQFAEPKKAEQPRRPEETKVYRGPQNDHLIADAVRIIQREKIVKRRASVLDFFKKL